MRAFVRFELAFPIEAVGEGQRVTDALVNLAAVACVRACEHKPGVLYVWTVGTSETWAVRGSLDAFEAMLSQAAL